MIKKTPVLIDEGREVHASLNEVKRLALFKQGLHRRPASNRGKAILNCVRRVGLIQLDSINVVARSHQLVILSRLGMYNPEDLDALLYPRRSLFEQWAHAECLLPVEDYEYFEPLILQRRNEPTRYRVQRILGNRPERHFRMVMKAIEKRGSLSSRDFRDSSSQKRSWWNRKPAKAALDGLFYQGHLMMDRRVNFECYYDLPDRVMPSRASVSPMSLQESFKWIVRQSIQCLGVATFPQIRDYYRQYAKPMREALKELLSQKVVVPVAVTGWNQPAYIAASDIPLLHEIKSAIYEPTLTTFLSPFDNLIWDRQRVRSLFVFDYRIESYQPSQQERRFGYYVMPILHNGRLVGRMDPKLVREEKLLLIHSIHLEPEESATDEILDAIVVALYEFADFHQATNIVVKHTSPASLKRVLLAKGKSRISA